MIFFFFFQAEDGIRDKLVTGVQTCALPSGPPATPATSSPSAYDSLSPGNKRIATALFDAQKTSTTGTPTLTLDQIARERRSGKSWGDVFQAMKSQGLIQAETLAQVIGRYDRARHSRS